MTQTNASFGTYETASVPTLPVLAQKCLDRGLHELSAGEERDLHDLFRKEVRKGAFVPPDTDSLRAFCAHVVREFALSRAVLSVVDYQPYLRERAKKASTEPAPVAALILYATWIEHWLNMIITVGMLRRGDPEAAIDAYFARWPPMDEKVHLLDTIFGLGALSKTTRHRLLEVTTTRNRFVHYSWHGASPAKVKQGRANVRSLVLRCDDLLDHLLEFERRALDAPFDGLAKALFPRAGST